MNATLHDGDNLVKNIGLILNERGFMESLAQMEIREMNEFHKLVLSAHKGGSPGT